jgi:hypothetical protein
MAAGDNYRAVKRGFYGTAYQMRDMMARLISGENPDGTAFNPPSLAGFGKGGVNRGPWAANTAYAANDIVNNNGTWYSAKVAFTSGSTFSTSNWNALPGSIQDGGTEFAVPGGAWNDTAAGGTSQGGVQNTTGFRIFLQIRGGVASDPSENGHIYLDIAPNNNGGAVPTTGWMTTSYVAYRNNQATGTGSPVGQAGQGALGAGSTVFAFVPNGWWYRLRAVNIYTTKPEYILDGAKPGFFTTMT